MFTLWSITVYFTLTKRPYVMTLIPALWMTAVCTTYIFVAPECLGNVIPQATWLGPTVGSVAAAAGLAFFLKWKSGVK